MAHLILPYKIMNKFIHGFHAVWKSPTRWQQVNLGPRSSLHRFTVVLKVEVSEEGTWGVMEPIPGGMELGGKRYNICLTVTVLFC